MGDNDKKRIGAQLPNGLVIEWENFCDKLIARSLEKSFRKITKNEILANAMLEYMKRTK